MTFDPETIDRLLAYLNGSLRPEKVRALETQLKDDPTLRKCLLELSVEEATLAEWAKAERVAAKLDDGAFTADDVVPISPAAPSSGAQHRFWFMVAVVAFSFLAVAASLWKTTPQVVSGVAQLVASTDADWTGTAPGLQAQMLAGSYHLHQGTIDLLFADGAKVSLSGPAVFELKSTRHIHLAAGQIRKWLT